MNQSSGSRGAGSLRSAFLVGLLTILRISAVEMLGRLNVSDVGSWGTKKIDASYQKFLWVAQSGDHRVKRRKEGYLHWIARRHKQIQTW